VRRPLILAAFALTAACAHGESSGADDLAWTPHTRTLSRTAARTPRLGPPVTTEDAGRRAMAGTAPPQNATLPPGSLEIYAINTRERVRVELFLPNGQMNEEAVGPLTHVLRDHRTELALEPNRRLLAILYTIGQHYGRPLRLVSAYRHPKRPRQRTSRHASAHAADITIEGVDPSELAFWVRSTFERVGVGYYPVSQFVHVDARDASYYWVDASGPGEAQRTRAVAVEPVPPPGTDWTVRFARME